jgi:hypothetical protein
MPASFTLYGNPGSSSSNRVRIMLAEAGFADYDFVSLDFKTAEQKVGSTLLTFLPGLHLTTDSRICVQTLQVFAKLTFVLSKLLSKFSTHFTT